MTASCEGTTTTTAYPVTLSFVVNPAGIEYRDPVVHCWIELGVEGDEATLVGQPAGCNTIIDAQVVPIDVTQATITSTGSSLNLMMAGTTSSCAITIAAGAAR